MLAQAAALLPAVLLALRRKSSGILFLYKMMVVDFTRQSSLGVPMDENEAELTRLLYTRIGMIMEDASIIALELGGPRSQFAEDKRKVLRSAVHTIVSLTSAVNALAE